MLLEEMVELGKRGFTLKDLTFSFNRKINHREIQTLARLTRNELIALMFFIDEKVLDGYPVEILDDDQLRMVYLEKKTKLAIEGKKIKMREVRKKQATVRRVTNKIMEVLMAI